MRLRILLSGNDLDVNPNTIIPLSFKYFDLTNITTRFVTVSPQFNLPATKNNLQLLGVELEEKSNAIQPYQKSDVKVIIDGVEILPLASLYINSVSDVISTQILGEESEFYRLLEGKTLRSLSISGLTPTVWGDGGGASARNNTTGLVDPLISYREDRTTIGNNPPSVYYHTIINKIFELTGYDKSGTVYGEEKYLKTIMPYSRPVYNDFSELNTLETVEVSADGTQTIINPVSYITVIFDQYIQGSGSVNYNGTDTYTVPAVANSGDYYEVNISGRLKYNHSGGQVIFRISNNGATAYLFELQPTGSVDFIFEGINSIRLSGTSLSNFKFELIATTGTPTVTIDTDSYVQYETTYYRPFVITNGSSLFPKVYLKDFIRDFVVRYGLVLKVQSNTVIASTFNEIINNKSNAVDWTNKRDYSEVSNVKYRENNFHQNNYFRYLNEDKEVDEDRGQGLFTINNPLLPVESEVKSIFTNIEDRSIGTSKYIVIRAIDENGDFELEGLRLCSVFDNPSNSSRLETHFLNSSAPYDMNFQDYIDDNYSDLVISLQKAKIVTRRYNLAINDVINYDPHRPIFDNGSYFLINEIKNFISGELTTVELLKIV